MAIPSSTRVRRDDNLISRYPANQTSRTVTVTGAHAGGVRAPRPRDFSTAPRKMAQERLTETAVNR